VTSQTTYIPSGRICVERLRWKEIFKKPQDLTRGLISPYLVTIHYGSNEEIQCGCRHSLTKKYSMVRLQLGLLYRLSFKVIQWSLSGISICSFTDCRTSLMGFWVIIYPQRISLSNWSLQPNSWISPLSLYGLLIFHSRLCELPKQPCWWSHEAASLGAIPNYLFERKSSWVFVAELLLHSVGAAYSYQYHHG
jgi:hypothetical protein